MLYNFDSDYGVISVGVCEDKQREPMHRRLYDELRMRGHHPYEVVDIHKDLPGRAWLVPSIKLENLVVIARKYGQGVVIFCANGASPRVLSVYGSTSPPTV